MPEPQPTDPVRHPTQSSPDAKLARHVASQLAHFARSMPDRPVELTISPEELGKVRMTLDGSDDRLTVHLAIERGDTADLVRRHLDSLGQEFRNLGYKEVRFNLAGGGKNGAPPDERRPSSGGARQSTAVTRIAEVGRPTPARLTHGIDIRL